LSFIALTDLLKDFNKENQVINGLGVSVALNGVGVLIMAVASCFYTGCVFRNHSSKYA